MKPRLAAILLLLVLLPLALLAWLGVRVAHEEQAIVQHKFRQLLTSKLEDSRAAVARLLDQRQRELLELTDALPIAVPPDLARLREIPRANPAIAALFVLDPSGRRLYPPPLGPLNTAERDFLQRAGQVWLDKQTFYRGADGASGDSTMPSVTPAHGWYTWYWGSGVHLLFWRRLATGFVVGVELGRVRLLADAVAELPQTDLAEPTLPQGRIALLDAKGSTVYQWGGYEPAEGEPPRATLPLTEPLGAWQLAYFASRAELDKAVGGGVLFSFVSGLVVVAIALVGLAVYFYRESSREMREAAQRVTFVNQVSHELKTPLTNIRMYAELLENVVPEDSAKAQRYLDVIGSESRRLSRLIGNVLTFARQQKEKLALHPSPGVVDEAVEAVVEHFRPSLEGKKVCIRFSGGAPARVQLDRDALEQILGNLFGNVEKYAAAGGLLEVATAQDDATTTLTVSDRGPGIPAGQRESIFEPFHRLSNRLADGVTGTGIGLSISRGLARLHGGDLTLEPSDAGARFRLSLRTPPATGPERGQR